MITEIIPGLFIGTVWDSYGIKKEWGLRICVAEWDNFSNEEQHDLMYGNGELILAPFMIYEKPQAGGINGSIPIWNSYANIKILEKISWFITVALDNNFGDVLVHCAAGVERSPLAVIWYLMNRNSISLDDAYKIVKQKRPIIEDRRSWIKQQF